MNRKYLIVGTLKNGEKLYANFTPNLYGELYKLYGPMFEFIDHKPKSGYTIRACNSKEAMKLFYSQIELIYIDKFNSITVIEIEDEEAEDDKNKDRISQSSDMARIVVTTDSGKTLYLNKERIDRICIPESGKCWTDTTFKYEFLEDKWLLFDKNELYNPKTWEVDMVPDLFDFDLFISMIITRYNRMSSDKIKEYKIQEREF